MRPHTLGSGGDLVVPRARDSVGDADVRAAGGLVGRRNHPGGDGD